jgi:hypothetical protein
MPVCNASSIANVYGLVVSELKVSTWSHVLIGTRLKLTSGISVAL